MKKLIIIAFIAALTPGCSSMNSIAGLQVGANVAAKGQIVGVTFGVGTNATTVGWSYQSGTNLATSGNANIPN